MEAAGESELSEGRHTSHRSVKLFSMLVTVKHELTDMFVIAKDKLTDSDGFV